MPLTAGTPFGSYEIIVALGAGGMGEVYRARDSKLRRDVALKVLAAAVAGDPDRMARFEREAQVLAALNHPNVAQIYGVEESGGQRALVMELVDGEELSAHLSRGRMPVESVLPIARQIAEALETAHDLGIVHRDLKPANIKIRPDGTVKVLDFGLAKAVDVAASGAAAVDLTNSPTLTTPAMTMAGVILGTAAYMAPEQAKGKPLDKRVDIWAFGVVLYEMLTGSPLFHGESVAETIGLIIARTPDWSALPSDTPSHVVALLQRCLTADPHQRLRDIGEARIALAAGREREAPPAAAARRGSRSRAWVAAACAFAAGAAGAAVLLTRNRSATSIEPLRRFELPAALAAASAGPVLAPDGSRIAYVAGNHLHVRAFDSLDAQDLGSVPIPTSNLFWSPDSRSIGFASEGTIRTMPASGGPMFVVCTIPATGRVLDVAWRSDGTIVFAAWRDSLYKVAATGGTPDVYLRVNPASDVDFHSVSTLPDNRVIVTTHLRDSNDGRAELYDGTHRVPLTLVSDALRFRYVRPGYLLFARRDANKGIWSVPFHGGPIDLSKAVRVEAGATDFDVADDGTLLAAIAPDHGARSELVWIDRQGQLSPLPGAPIEGGTGQISNLSLSPDGRRVVFIGGAPPEVFVRDLASGLDTRLTFDGQLKAAPSWDPGGDRVLYTSGMEPVARPGGGYLGKVVSLRADGSDDRRELAAATDSPRVSPDGRALIYCLDDNGRRRLRVARIDESGTVGPGQPFFHEPEPDVASFALSPDGRLLAYAARNPSMKLDLLLTEFPTGAGRWQVHAGANQPRFSRDGRTLFFTSGTVDPGGEPVGQLMKTPVQSVPTVRVGPEAVLFTTRSTDANRSGVLDMGYDVAPDGRILTSRTLAEPGGAARLVLLEHWLATLGR